MQDEHLFYWPLFDSKIGRHRDNGLLLEVDNEGDSDGEEKATRATHARLGHSEDENSQIRGSSVMVYTEGPPMDFALVLTCKVTYVGGIFLFVFEQMLNLVDRILKSRAIETPPQMVTKDAKAVVV